MEINYYCSVTQCTHVDQDVTTAYKVPFVVQTSTGPAGKALLHKAMPNSSRLLQATSVANFTCIMLPGASWPHPARKLFACMASLAHPPYHLLTLILVLTCHQSSLGSLLNLADMSYTISNIIACVTVKFNIWGDFIVLWLILSGHLKCKCTQYLMEKLS